MKQIIAAAALAAAALAPMLAHAGLDSDNPVHPLIGIALTGGGDKLSSVEFSNGGSKDITAGGLVQVYGGVEYHEKGARMGFQATVGYHFDNTSARNGSQRFERFPIEAIALYNVAPQFRLGIGARYAAGARFTSSGAGEVGNGDGDFKFKSQLSGMLLGEWLITPSMGLQLRYVHETFKLNGTSIDGSHGGLGFNYYF
jgi:hypothetical protein